MITPVCQSFGAFPGFNATWQTLANQSTPSLFNDFNISGRISSSQAAFADFSSHVAAVTYVNVKISSFPKSIESLMSVGVAHTGFNKSTKYSIHRKRISLSFLRMVSVEFLMEVVAHKLFPRKRRMVCQYTLFADE